jgi:hypothetical protein
LARYAQSAGLASAAPFAAPVRLALRLTQDAAVFRSQLEYLLADPEMTALLAEVPQAGRILRPLCHMLGIAPGPALRLARRQRPAPAPSMSASGHPAVSGRSAVPGGPPPDAQSRSPERPRPNRIRSPEVAGADPPLAWLAWPTRA